MSRHRNLKYMEDDYEDYDDDYGASPSPAQESYLSDYMYKRGQQQQQKQPQAKANSSTTTAKSSKFETDAFLVKDCMDYILDILGGETQTDFTKEELEDAIRKNMYDADVALDYLYDLKERKLKQKTKTPSSPIGTAHTSKDNTITNNNNHTSTIPKMGRGSTFIGRGTALPSEEPRRMFSAGRGSLISNKLEENDTTLQDETKSVVEDIDDTTTQNVKPSKVKLLSFDESKLEAIPQEVNSGNFLSTSRLKNLPSGNQRKQNNFTNFEKDFVEQHQSRNYFLWNVSQSFLDKAQETIFQFDEPSPDDLAIQGREGKKVQKQADKAPNFKPIQKKNTKENKKNKQQQQTTTQKDNKTNPQSAILVVKNEKPMKKVTTPIGNVKSKPIQDADKERVNVVVIGHVDAGKSTLMGHVLVALGHVPDRILHKYKKEAQEMGKGSFAFAWVFDENEEERARGVTIDVGIRHFETEKRHVTILDAPGHRDFVPNMITGAAQADIAILVVDSSIGEFESGFKSGGQTKEHLILAKSLGISEIIVAVNKLDNVQWDQSRFDSISQELGKFTRHIGYRDEDVKYIPCSGLLGENLTFKSKVTDLQSWYRNGPCLIEAIDNAKTQKRDSEKGLRLSIADFYKPQHTGAAVNLCGKIESGHVSVNDKVIVMPTQEECQVKTITRNKKVVNSAFAGDNVEIGLNGIDIEKVQVGQILCDIFDRVKQFRRFRASVIIFDTPLPLIKGSQCVLHIHHSNVSCVISKLMSIVDKNFEVIQKRPRALTKNVTANVEIICEYAICAEVYSEHKSFGRFTLRQEGQTIAAGMITKIRKDKKKRDPFSTEGVETQGTDINHTGGASTSQDAGEDEPIISSDIPQTKYMGDEDFDFM